MKTKIAILSGLAGLLALAPGAQAQSLLEKIATTVLADKFGIDTRDVVVLHDRVGGSVYDLAPYYEMSHYGRTSPSRVYELRRSGLGWGQVAHKIGMHPGTFNKLRKQGAFDRDRFWTSNYRDRFGVQEQQITVLRRSGGSLEDVLGAIILGKLSKQNPQNIYDQFQTDRSWTTVSTRYNAPLTDWRRVSVPVRTVYRIPVYTSTQPRMATVKAKKGVRDHGEGVGKGKSQGASHKSTGHTGGGVAKAKGNSGSAKAHGNSGKSKGNQGGGGGKAKGGGGKGKGKGG